MSANLTEPTVENVRSACKTFDEWNDNPDPALRILFEHYPCNAGIEHVLLKVVMLNATYSTMIRGYSTKAPSFYDVARHIVSLKVDQALGEGDAGVVERIAALKTDDNRERRNYSFATKYCNWHRPNLYPIYDSRVDTYLWELNRKKSFFIFHRQDLHDDYPKFKEIVIAFRTHFGLDDFNFKEIDKFLYVSGGTMLQVNLGEIAPETQQELK